MNEQSDENAKPVVLVVDDDPENINILKRPFAKGGYMLLTAGSGKEALELLENNKIDVVLLDWMMPVMSGIDVLREIKARDEWKFIQVIMVTAKATSEDVSAGLRFGANDYLTKPIKRLELMARVAASMRERRLMLQLEESNANLVELNSELEKRNEFIKDLFGRYISDEVVAKLLETPHGFALGGDKRKVSVLVSDLRGFSIICEKLPSENVVEMLNKYFETMIDIIARYQGTICDFVGDAIMALFGAPIQREDDSKRAIACAIEMQNAMRSVNVRNKTAGLPELEMGIGVNTGVVVAGNIGSFKRVKYGVVGAAVNIASRIETCTVGGQILISEPTLNDAGADIKIGKKFSVHFKGASEPVPIYEVRGIDDNYNVRLDEQAFSFTTISDDRMIYFVVMEGKSSSASAKKAKILKLSEKEVVFSTQTAIDPLSDLKLSFTENAPGTDCFYGKLMEKIIDPADSYLVRFTSSPEIVKRYLSDISSM